MFYFFPLFSAMSGCSWPDTNTAVRHSPSLLCTSPTPLSDTVLLCCAPHQHRCQTQSFSAVHLTNTAIRQSFSALHVTNTAVRHSPSLLCTSPTPLSDTVLCCAPHQHRYQTVLLCSARHQHRCQTQSFSAVHLTNTAVRHSPSLLCTSPTPLSDTVLLCCARHRQQALSVCRHLCASM